MTVLELPWPPSVNHYWRFGNGHFHISTEGKRYKATVAGILATAGIQPLRGAVKLTIDAFPPDRRKRDLDNLQKSILDSCVYRRGFATGLYLDDSQVKRLEATMHDFDPAGAGRVVVTVSPWPGTEAVGIPIPVPVHAPGMEGGTP